MDDDDALPPAIRRSPQAARARQTAATDARFEDHDFPNSASSRQDKVSRFNPLAAHPMSPPRAAHPSRHGDDQDVQTIMQNWESLKPICVAPQPTPSMLPGPQPHRSPAKLKSYRTNKRLPPHLRRRISLETIKSVATTHSLPSDEDEDELEEESDPYFLTTERDGKNTAVLFNTLSLNSSKPSSSVGSKESTGLPDSRVHSVDERVPPGAAPKTTFRHMLRKPGGPAPAADRLIIERTVSVDQTSHRSSNSGSKSSLPQDRSKDSALIDAERRSGTSSEWSASEFDASKLTEAELLKCKKKGINPALFAEMKAARKGKWYVTLYTEGI